MVNATVHLTFCLGIIYEWSSKNLGTFSASKLSISAYHLDTTSQTSSVFFVNTQLSPCTLNIFWSYELKILIKISNFTYC